ncbi:MAG: LysM peptidoglycan-binding domain-containing C40 family peptidase [Armatimonadetes bacterium]|nr:LysM peptidoglycan-binding domain-containing C40 family peptidase [Armatimonadota bacterium]
MQRGDSLSKLSERFGVSMEELAERNGLRADSLLPIGLELVISAEAESQEPPAQPAELRYYVVQKGDCLWTIARRYDTTAPVLARMNGLRLEDVLPVGLRLVVPTSAPGVEPSHFVETALRYQGVRYRWGGMTTRGMDCSGLVARVLKVNGIDAPHNSRELYKLGVPVSKANLQAGDLVFFNTNGKGISHVGMYLGEGEFIHASSARGEVRIDKLTEGYYQRRYVGARRVQ